MKLDKPRKGVQVVRHVKVVNIGKGGNITVIEIDGVKYSYLKESI